MIDKDGVRWTDDQQRHGAMVAFWGCLALIAFIAAARWVFA